MAQRNIYTDINLNGQTLVAAKIYPLPTSSRTSLSLGVGDEGIHVFDTTLDELYAWSGSAWIRAVSTVTGAMIFRGGIAANASAPGSPANGDTYVFTSAGTTGVSWSPQATVQVGDQVVWDSANSVWRYIQANIDQATSSTIGLVALGTQAEVNAGTDSNKVVTPSTLAGLVPANSLTARLARRVVINISSLAANTPQTVTHNLELANQNDVVVACWQGNALIDLAVSSSSVNAVSVESNVALSNVRVVCIG